jgi:hypothetical protein
MATLHRLRLLSRRYLRVNVTRYPLSDPLFLVGQLLRSHRITVVLDVGAKNGGYASINPYSRLRGQNRLIRAHP